MTATIKFVSTVNSKLSQLEVSNGQLIFVSDTRNIYLDFNGVRTEYSQIVILANESDRVNYLTPITAFYFVKETKVLWRFENGEWHQLTTPPKESIIFLNYSNFPAIGTKEVLYISESDTYIWDGKSYIKLGEPVWGYF